MFTPIGFFAPQGAAGFDPTLGGTLTVSYWWDFTDSSKMSLTGTDIDSITDKVGSITLTPYTGTTKAVFNTTKTTFNGQSSYYNTSNWVPDEMKSNVDFTIVQFSKTNFSSFPSNSIISPWNLSGNRGDGFGHNNIRVTNFSPGYDPYSMTTCLSGTYYFAAQRWDGGWTGKKQAFTGTPAQADKKMVTFVYDVTNTQIKVNVNDNALCNISDTFTSVQQSGLGFQIGARDTAAGKWYGDMYHTIVYQGALSQTNINDLYAYWLEFNNPTADLVPVGGYTAYIDFKDSPITLNGSNISQIDDLSGNGFNATQTTTAQQPYWNPAGYYDGQSTSNQRWLNWPNTNEIFDARSPRTNDYELVIGVSENPHRHVIGGLGSSANDRVEYFMNDSVGRRDGIAMPRQYYFFSTNDENKDIILFNSTNSSTLNLYGYMQTLQNGNTAAAWAGDSFTTQGRIGRSARDQNLPGDGWQGKIYFYLVYPRTLTSQERIDIRDWAVNKWGMTLT